MKRNSQAGFAHVTVILVLLLVVGVVAFAGYRVWEAQSDSSVDTATMQTTTSSSDSVPAATQSTIDSQSDLKASDEALTQTASDLNTSLDTSSLDSDINSLY